MLRGLSKALQGACARAWHQMQVSETPLQGAAVEEPLPCDGQYLFQPGMDLSLLFSPQLVVLCLGPRRSSLALEPRGMGWMNPWAWAVLAPPLSIPAPGKGWQPGSVPGSSWKGRFVFWYQTMHTVTPLTVSAPSSELRC